MTSSNFWICLAISLILLSSNVSSGAEKLISGGNPTKSLRVLLRVVSVVVHVEQERAHKGTYQSMRLGAGGPDPQHH
ncbi:hypothetical protein Sjap_025887 [Stephania japonica]|uniref:CLAVATA3/ESR (CLE)-related protein n=1 Tax=Stephania japonica TaxID=461633 RepID=A0AAP0E2L5_9MAGN